MDNDLSLYKPNISVAQAFSVDESLPDNELTFDVWKKLLLALRTQDAVFLSIGKLFKLIHDKKLYRHLDYETFSQFLSSEEVSFSREKAYMYIRVWEHYAEYLQISEEKIKNLSVSKLSLMLPAIKKIDNKEEQIQEVERMNSLRYGDFMHEVKKTNTLVEKPTMMFSEERQKWVVYYYEDKTELFNKGKFQEGGDE